MVITFEKEYLKELYINGRASNKKYPYQPDIVKRYQRRIDTLAAAPSPETLYQVSSLHFEALSVDLAGLYSIRVNDQYRIEFTLDSNPDKPLITICNIVELSNHYK